jgi:hypothetical protein
MNSVVFFRAAGSDNNMVGDLKSGVEIADGN